MVAAQTIEALKAKSLLARQPEIDLILRLAGTTQISEAIKTAGARKGEAFILIVAGTGAFKAAKALGGESIPPGNHSVEDYLRIERAALLSAKRP